MQIDKVNVIVPPTSGVLDMGAVHRLLHCVADFNNDQLSRIKPLFNSQRLADLDQKFEANLKKRNIDIGFNLFSIISDVYYRENLHSDILAAFLDHSW